jgi:GGDEF domain-containing protein
MVGLGQERILLIGDGDRQMGSAIARALPGAQVTSVPDYFDGIAEFAGNQFTTVLAAVEPIERRPEPAMRILRELTGDGRLLLFGHPTLEPLSRKMLDFGCDDYVITPASTSEIQQVFGAVPLRLTPAPSETPANQADALVPSAKVALLRGLPLAAILLDALYSHPQDVARMAVAQINARLAPKLRLEHVAPNQPEPPTPAGMIALSHALHQEGLVSGTLILQIPKDDDAAAARHALAELAHLFGRLGQLEERHHLLERLAITDELTGVYNGRYFKRFLKSICDRALEKQFSVTLLLFDIDDFKKYNDLYGHGVGDDILRQTASLMRRCCREHDLVARISGDEFAVVFWDKEGPRVPRDVGAKTGGGISAAAAGAAESAQYRSMFPAPHPARPQHPWQVFERFKQLIASPEFALLGATGKGTLTISGGLAAFPWETREPEKLIELADRRLMFGAKKVGKDTLVLVGEEECLKDEQPPPVGELGT